MRLLLLFIIKNTSVSAAGEGRRGREEGADGKEGRGRLYLARR